MTQPEPRSQPEEPSGQPTFLRGIEFLTGPDPNLGSFLLVIGIVTCVFIALFQFTMSAPVSHLLTAGVITITVVSAGFAALLDSLNYFDQSTESTSRADPEPVGNSKPWVPEGKVSAALPPMINFDEELSELQAHFDGELPSQLTAFVEDYRRLKTNPSNRMTIASDLRADLNPVGVTLDEGTPEYELYEQISDGLFRYIGDSADHLTVADTTCRDAAGQPQDIAAVAGDLAVFDFSVHNEGEATDVEVVAEFYDGDESLSSWTGSLKSVSPAATETISTNIYVPESADRIRTDARPA
ncbi:hypothetical protein GCM10008995_23590 [Halobellus salinus]|uniref:Uncharacterized protein n=1 Tax=Halobellus salinus TaxID=931585 RepID=A0A830EI88_9EURY|nr:hypothetical protein [Halobellus salinus]GGJ13021.1 hypothetical protein GCM10008995_23590 [Halobellus salinus]SMP32429.1 hypothetical protein SAMN06265347_12032 [Halobellus salinus]